MIQEITVHCTQEQRARAFSFLQITFGLGTTVGVFIGGKGRLSKSEVNKRILTFGDSCCIGSLYNPVGMFPRLFDDHDNLKLFLIRYPAFLPCFIAALISAIGWVLGLLFLKETLVVVPSPLDHEQDHETTPLLNSTSKQPSSPSSSILPGQRRSSNAESRLVPSTDILSKLKKSLTGPVVFICLTYGMVAFQNVFYDSKCITIFYTSHSLENLSFFSQPCLWYGRLLISTKAVLVWPSSRRRWSSPSPALSRW